MLVVDDPDQAVLVTFLPNTSCNIHVPDELHDVLHFPCDGLGCFIRVEANQTHSAQHFLELDEVQVLVLFSISCFVQDRHLARDEALVDLFDV